MQPDQQQRIMGYFIEEAKDHLNTIEQGLLNLQSTIEDTEMINEVFRAAHSVKGGAAMLGLNGIQRVSHRLEDFFKVLKESPIQVDQKLETLFLRAFDALQELLGQLQGPFGLTEDAANQIIAGVEPTFEELEQHLNQLAGTPLPEIPVTSGLDLEPELATNQLQEALEQLFRNEVPLRLREMLQLFKQPETDPTARQQLQELCRSLGSMGEQYQLDSWCNLVETARRAIAHPENPYRVLAPIVIRDIKLAQELVLAGRTIEITPCTQLQDMVPTAVIPSETLVQDDLADLLTGDLPTADSLVDSDLSLDLPFADLMPGSDLDLTGADLDADLADLDIRQGPEVGTAELNSLADLFEGEMPELGLTWQQEEILADGSDLSATEAGLEGTSDAADFSDLLFDDSTVQASDVTSPIEDLNDLFGDDLDDLPTQASTNPPATAAPDSELDDFADLLEISESTLSTDAAEPATEFDPSLEAAGDLSLLGFDDSTDFDLGLSEPSAPNPGAELNFDTAPELELDGALDDLDNLFDGLNELDGFSSTEFNSTASEEPTLVADPWSQVSLDVSEGESPEAQDLEDLNRLDLIDSPIANLDELSGESDAASAFDFDFDDLMAINPIDAPEAGEALSSDSSGEPSILFSETEDPLIFGDAIDSLGLDSALFDELSSDTALSDLDLSDPNTADSVSDFDALELNADELISELELQPDNEAAIDLNLADLNLTDLGQFDLAQADFLTPPLEANLSPDSSPVIPDPWSDEALEIGEPAATSFTDLQLDDLSLDEQGSTENLSLTDLENDADLENDDLLTQALSFEVSETPGATETWLQDLGDGDLDLPLNEFDIESLATSEVSSFDIELNNLEVDTAEVDSASDLDSLFGTIIQEDINLDDDVLSFEKADAESFSPSGNDSELAAASLEELTSAAPAAVNLDFNQGLDESLFALSDSSLEEDEFLLGIADASTSSPGEAESLFEMTDVSITDASIGDAELDLDEPASIDANLLSGMDDGLVSDEALLSSADLLSDGELLLADGSLPDLESGDASDSFGDLDDLLGSESDERAIDALEPEPSNSFGDLDSSFGDLDNLLGDSEFSDFPVNATSTETNELENFADIDQLSPLDDLDGLEDLLGQENPLGQVTASQAAIDEFGDLETLLDSDPTSNFADLDGLLDDSNFSPGSDLVGEGFDNASHSIVPAVSDSEDFSDLESLLSEDGLEGETDLTTTASGMDSEFDDLNDLLKDAEERMGGSPSVKVGAGITQARRVMRPGRVFSEQTMRVPVKHLDNLSNLVGELVVNRNSLEQDQERLRQSLDNLLYQVQQLSDVGQRMQDLYERSLLESSLLASRQGYRSPLPGRPGDSTVVELEPHGSNGMEYDPLEMDRFTGFHSLSQEMIELIVRVRESSSDIEFIVDETEQVTRMFRQVTTQLQEGLTRSRMVPFAQTADRLPRAVRDISMKVGKQAELVIEGRETLIDKMILEQLYDPMTHLVNNAITHGIEPPAVRIAAGKPPAGRISIRAFHQGNQTIISVSDDGAGIDVERVKTKAVEKGLLTSAEARTISRLDVYDILFHPGFSTKDQADDFSGRGVGMDVVRTSLSDIRGVINTDSNSGKGTTFTIRLPLTLSISKALCCISDRARIAFPMDGVEDMLDLPKERIQTNADGQPCIAWRDTILPVRPLADLLGYNRHLSRGNVYGGNQEDDMVSIVVLRSAGNFLALQVDQVMGEQEIVIKQLEGPVPKPVGVAGATVLGDGRIMPIADVLELIDLSMGRIRRDAGGSLWEQEGVTAIPDTPVAKTEPMVLIVDDSITVRELLSMTFNKVGYRVEQARDGQEAWEKLRSGLPCDIVFCDIEMPRMDGLELLSRIQKDANLKHLPIAMLTSRGADRHRQMAATLGASGYFTKPYLEEALLDAAQRMLKGERLLTS
ncbi:MAG: response regulator [Leptolyngbyaceae cyanobacterium bins.302]|nr:response regulator [Leptolyngbyaceae cyanobacterium bins.302]